jgi:N-acetylglucosamine-6-phosphate deacetylase
MIDSFSNIKKIITIAPEYKNNAKYIDHLSKNSTVSLGHTNASCEQTSKANNSGAKHLTHLFNSMPKFEHRSPTIINEAFENKRCLCEFICDLVHIEPLAIKNIYHIIGTDRLMLVTDTLSCKGLPNGRYMLGSLPINKHSHIATLLDNKMIAGSIQPYNEQLKNFYKTTKCSLNELVKISSYNQAKSLKLKDVGDIKVGYKANFVIVDKNINLKSIYFLGAKLR